MYRHLLWEFWPLLAVYHFVVSMVAAAGCVMTMQLVGQRWTIARNNRVLQQCERVGLMMLSIALVCSGVRVPVFAGNPIVLASAAAVNTALLLVIVPAAIIGQRQDG